MRDLLDAPRGRAEQERLAGARFEDHLFVQLADAQKLEPGSAAVKSALEGLNDDRQRLVEEYLEMADRLFATQELEKAAPYFKRVLRLEPDNIRAKDALHMYENLLKIKQGH